MEEASIVIEDNVLTKGQSMAVRVAVTGFLMQLDDPEFAASLGEIAGAYRDRLTEVVKIMMKGNQ